MSFVQRPTGLSGNDSCLLSMHLTLPEDPPRDDNCYQQVFCRVGCAHYAVNPWLPLVLYLVL